MILEGRKVRASPGPDSVTLPDVFRRIVEGLHAAGGLGAFRYYLDRHVELDGDDHDPMAERLVADLCGDDPARWRTAERAALASLEARMTLWDGIVLRLDGRVAGRSNL